MPRVALIAGPALLLLVAAISLIAGLAFGGGADAPLLLDPGPVVRYGLPASQLLTNLAAAAVIGTLVLLCFALNPAKPEFDRSVDFAAGAAALWTVAGAITGFFTFLSVYSEPLRFDNAFGSTLFGFFTDTALGKAWLNLVVIAAIVTVLLIAVRNLTALAFVVVLAVDALVPLALQGHRGGTAQHDAATSAIFLHVLFATIWLGGLVALAVIRPLLDKGRLTVVLRRFSTIALVCFVVVAVSGYVSAQIRVDSFGNLLTPYGILVIVKVAALIALGIFGAIQRRFVIARMEAAAGARRYFWGLLGVELVFMGLASGVAVALAKTATPVREVSASELANPSPAELLTGAPLPPPLNFEHLVTLWNFDLIWILVCGFGVFFYVAGVLRLRKRGDSWPVHRTVLWISGMLVLFLITNGGVNAYEKYLFSAHMAAHMTLGMAVPVLLVPGAPITLALRALDTRFDGSRGPREWLLVAVHSRPFAVLANPLVVAAIFVGSLWIFYYSPVFSWATTDHVGHEWMIVHFLIAGYLFVQALIGVDPSPRRSPYPIRLIVLLATMTFHAFFGLALMSGTGLLLSDWYGAMGWPSGTAIADQQAGGAIAWGVGEIPTVVLAVVVAIMWSRSDDRESKRIDRQADRDGDAELEAYNAMLAKRAARP